MDQHELFEDKFKELVEKIDPDDLSSDATTKAVQNLKTFSECRPRTPDLEPTPSPVPTTAWEKFKYGVTRFWDNETTRTCIKVAGPLTGVVVVAYSTIKKDHVLERQAISQANQSPMK